MRGGGGWSAKLRKTVGNRGNFTFKYDLDFIVSLTWTWGIGKLIIVYTSGKRGPHIMSMVRSERPHVHTSILMCHFFHKWGIIRFHTLGYPHQAKVCLCVTPCVLSTLNQMRTEIWNFDSTVDERSHGPPMSFQFDMTHAGPHLVHQLRRKRN